MQLEKMKISRRNVKNFLRWNCSYSESYEEEKWKTPKYLDWQLSVIRSNTNLSPLTLYSSILNGIKSMKLTNLKSFGLVCETLTQGRILADYIWRDSHQTFMRVESLTLWCLLLSNELIKKNGIDVFLSFIYQKIHVTNKRGF